MAAIGAELDAIRDAGGPTRQSLQTNHLYDEMVVILRRRVTAGDSQAALGRMCGRSRAQVAQFLTRRRVALARKRLARVSS